MTLRDISEPTAAQWLESLPPDHLTLLYKHSPACGISYDAADEVAEFDRGQTAVTVYRLDVIRQRPLSQDLARELAVPHHSPQVILLRGRIPVWHTSHQRIRASELAARIRASSSP